MSILSSITHASALCAVLLFGAPSGAVLAEGSNSPAQGGSATAEQSAMVNINTATAAEIAEGLVGIGPAKAEAIVAWREAHGPFTSKEQLLEVKGIGQATLDKNVKRIGL